MNWNAYALRRNINVGQWLTSRGVKDRAGFLKLLDELGLQPPDGTQLLSMFPELKEQKAREVKNESIAHPPEGIDQVAPRGVAGEGNGSNQRSDRKRSSKVRD